MSDMCNEIFNQAIRPDSPDSHSDPKTKVARRVDHATWIYNDDLWLQLLSAPPNCH